MTAPNECFLHLLRHLDCGQHQHRWTSAIHLGRIHGVTAVHVRELFVAALIDNRLIVNADVIRDPRHTVVVLAVTILLNLGADHMQKLKLLVMVVHALECHRNLGR